MWYLQFVGMLYPWLLLSHIIFILSWLRLQKRYYLFSLATILLGWSHFTHFVGWSIFDGSTDGVRLKIMTCNIDNFAHFYDKQNGVKNITDLEKFIKTENPDIICLQESFIKTTEYTTRLRKFPCLLAYPYILHPVEKGIVILSKIAPIQHGKIAIYEDFKETANGANFADFTVQNKPIRLIVTHLQSNSVRERTEGIVDAPTLRDEETQSTIKDIIRRVRDMSYLRAKQAEGIKAFIKRSPYPVIVAGDFNDTPQSYTYAQISDGLQDAFAKKGFGLGITYGGVIPALRIDYILASSKLNILSHRIYHKPYSDHYPVMAEIEIP
jgi:endonuclease/exonuclease/phosphatase family metal-dependent hydrolase